MLLGKKSTRHKKQGTRFKIRGAIIGLVSSSYALHLEPCTFYITFASMKILMVCLGNICRSPLAEGILQDKAWKAGLKWRIESAGTNNYHIGEAPHPLSQKVAKLNGIDICKQRKRKFVAEDFNR